MSTIKIDPDPADKTLDTLTEKIIFERLTKYQNNKTCTARSLDISKWSLYRMMKRFNIDLDGTPHTRLPDHKDDVDA